VLLHEVNGRNGFSRLGQWSSGCQVLGSPRCLSPLGRRPVSLVFEGCVWGRAGPMSQFFLFFLFLKINLKILIFYITSIIIQIKKSQQNKFFHFFIQNIFTFFLTLIKSTTLSFTSFFKPLLKYCLNSFE
jgi:hypothetical protein